MVSARPLCLLLGLACALGAACTDFEDPQVVIDMRILAMRADPPEILVPYDPAEPTRVDLADLAPIQVCVLVADPTEQRGLTWSMSLCPPTGSGRCRGNVPIFDLGGGTVGDPETSEEPVSMCAVVEPNADLLTVLAEALSADDLAGFGGISAQVTAQLGPEGRGGAGDDDTLFGFKRLRYSPELPADRVANTNPTVNRFVGARRPTGERGLDFDIPIGRCGEIEPFTVAPGERVALLPDEPAGVREEYAVPTFDGGERHFTENLTYQWHSTEGKWSPFESGGTIDVAGNEPPLDSTWTAPDDAELIGDGLDVRIWIVQRDERGGQTWYESCARVVP